MATRDNDGGLLTRQFACDELGFDSEDELDELIKSGEVRQGWFTVDADDEGNRRDERRVVAADVARVKRDRNPKALAAQVPRLNGGSGRTNADLEGIERL